MARPDSCISNKQDYIMTDVNSTWNHVLIIARKTGLAMRIRLSILVLLLLSFHHISVGQEIEVADLEVDFDFGIDRIADFSSITYHGWSDDLYTNISHSPTKADSQFFVENGFLMEADVNEENYSKFDELACVLWRLGHLEEAEKMFLQIIESNQSFYVGTYYSNSDIPGDTTTNVYGYGSYTSNYKNYASRYLAKIYIEQGKFEKALTYVGLADHTYLVQFNCGTGHRRYRNQIDGLWAMSYLGLEQYDSVMALFFDPFSFSSNITLIECIKRKYTPTQIQNYLKEAERSIQFTLDTVLSTSSSRHNYGEPDEYTTEAKFTSGSATMSLFGRTVNMRDLYLADGQTATREMFVKRFINSSFYHALRVME